MQWHMQEVSNNTNLKVDIYYTLPELSVTKIVTWYFHVDDSTKGRYDMILRRYLFTDLGLNLKFPDHVIEAYGGPFKGSTAPMIDMGAY